MLFSALLVTSVFVAESFASPVAQTQVVHEKRTALPHGWTRRDALDRRAILPMRVALAQSNLEKGHDWLMDVSHPDSEKYSAHWTAEEVAQAFAPRYCVTPDETGGTSY